MCGIFGFTKVTPHTIAMAPLLGVAMANRGTDSWGCTDGVNYEKQGVSIIDGFATFTDWHRWDSVLFHTRGASVGKVNQRNAHPFHANTTDGKLVVGVHNGHVSNWKDLNKKYKRDFDVDSEHIIAHIAEGRDLNDLDVVGVAVWYNAGKLFWVKTHSGQLDVVILEDGTVVYCSTPDPLYIAAKMVGAKIKHHITDITAGKIYFPGVNKQGKATVFYGEDIHFGKKPEPVKHYSSSGFNGNVGKGEKRPNCAICYAICESKDAVICQHCFREGTEVVDKWVRDKEVKNHTGHGSVGMYVN